ncbi:hypothetical protein ABK040_008751 [Willaertia magna]
MAHGFAYGFAALITWGTVALGFWYGGNEVAMKQTTLGSIFKVFVKGVMKEKGRHQELIKIPNGIYRKLAEKQMVLVEESVEDVEDVMDVLVDNENEQQENVKEE